MAGTIEELLLQGEENAVTLAYLVKVTGLSARGVRRMIARERLAGAPILANNKTGYYLPSSDHETQKCVRSMRHRAVEIIKGADAIERSSETNSNDRVPEMLPDQMRMGEW